MEQLPAESPYRQTNSPGLWAAIRQLWVTAARNYAARDLPAAASAVPAPMSGEVPKGVGAEVASVERRNRAGAGQPKESVS
jgi:hypothetical protein